MLSVQTNLPDEFPISIQLLNNLHSSELYIVLLYVDVYSVFVVLDVVSGQPLMATNMTYAGPLPQQPNTLLSSMYGTVYLPDANASILGYRVNWGAVDQSMSLFDGIDPIIRGYSHDNQVIHKIGRSKRRISISFVQETSMLQNISVTGSTTTGNVTSLIPPFSLLSVPTTPNTTVSIPKLATTTTLPADTLFTHDFSVPVPISIPALPLNITSSTPVITQPTVSTGPGTLHIAGLNTGFTQAAQFGYTTSSSTSPYTFSDTLQNFVYPGGTIRVFLFVLVNTGATNSDVTLTVTGTSIPGMSDGERMYSTAAQQSFGAPFSVCYKFVLTPTVQLAYGTVLNYSFVGSNINKFLYVFGYYDSLGTPNLEGTPTSTLSPITISNLNVSGTSSPYATTVTSGTTHAYGPTTIQTLVGATQEYTNSFSSTPVTVISPNAGVNIMGASSGAASLTSSVSEPVVDVYHVKFDKPTDPLEIFGNITVGLNRSGI